MEITFFLTGIVFLGVNYSLLTLYVKKWCVHRQRNQYLSFDQFQMIFLQGKPVFQQNRLRKLVSDLRPIEMLTEEIAVEVTRVVGVSPALWYFRYIASICLTPHKRLWCIWCSCGTVALMVLGQFSDICGLWSANIRKLAKDNKGYGSAAISGGTTRSQTMI